METVTKKMSFNEYWESVVGKVAQLQEDIKTKNEELTSTLLALIEKHGVIPEDSQEEKLESKPEQKETSETENTQNQDPAFEVPLTPEQYAIMRAWIDAKDFIEIFTGPGETKATVFNSRLLWRKNHPDWKNDEIGELLRLNVPVMSLFIDFIKEYMRFFGCKDDLETFCMKAIYEKVQSLNGDLEKFAGTHDLNTSDWLARFNERTHGPGQDEENDC